MKRSTTETKALDHPGCFRYAFILQSGLIINLFYGECFLNKYNASEIVG